MKFVRFLMMFAMAMVSTAAWAGDQDFELVNGTGDVIEAFYTSPAGVDSWEEDILGRDVLGDGESTVIEFSHDEGACKWDFKVRYSDGEEVVWYGIDLCVVSRVTLKWDPSTKQTFATVE